VIPDDKPLPEGTDSTEYRLDSKDPGTRTSLGCASVFLGAIAAWMIWFVHKFLDGAGWVEFLIRTLLDELAFSIGLFAIVILIWALFTPEWIRRSLTAATERIMLAVIVFFALLLGVPVVLLAVFAVLALFGVKV
jgi:hypothetical protein